MSPKIGLPSSLALVVENDRDTRELYAEFLAFSGLRVEQAATADEAMEKAQRLRPDVITTDIGLPGGDDGCALCVRLKVDDRTKTIPVIAVTAWAIGGHVQRARDAGCDAVLIKPCSPQDLLTEIERLLTATTAPHSLEEIHRAELRIVRAHPLNVLLEGTPAVTEAMLRVVRPHIHEPVVWQPRHALQLPAADIGALILRDVSALTDDEQTAVAGRGRRTHTGGIDDGRPVVSARHTRTV